MKPKSLPSRLFNRNYAAASGEALNIGAAKYQRHVDCVDPPESEDNSAYNPKQTVADNNRQNEKGHREMHFSFLPEKYKPLMDDEAQAKTEEEKKRKKEKYKKVKKVGVPFKSFQISLKLKWSIITNLQVHGLHSSGIEIAL